LKYSDFLALSAKQIAIIPSAAASGFTIEQISNMSIDGCSGLTPEQMFAINSTSYIGFNTKCISSIAPTSFSQIVAAQFRELDPIACSGIREELVS
jgi:hypothetical protein